MKGLKYCLFGCLTSLVAPCDGLYTCFKTIMAACSENKIKEFNKDIQPSFTFLSEKIRVGMDLQVGAEPLKTFATFTP